MVYLESHSTDPYFNLALEEYIFEHMDRSRQYFLLWQNDRTIVVGKYQKHGGRDQPKLCGGPRHSGGPPPVRGAGRSTTTREI